MSLPRRALGWLRRHGLMLLGATGLLVYYLWMASSSGDPIQFSHHDSSYYNQLGDGFLNGKLHLLTKPSPHLAHLANPYDPAANYPDRVHGFHDMSLYHGRLYLYWGPVPALLLYLPFRLLSLGDMPDTLATALFAFVGTCFAVALLRYLTRRYLPKTPSWMLALGTLGVVAGSALPFTLRRVFIYEVAICAGYCLAFAGLYFLATGVLERPYRLHRLALSSLCFGLAVGSRPSMILPALLPIAALSWILLRDRPQTRRRTVGIAAALAGPLAVCGVLLAVYNALRFGSITEFGQHYQLAGIDVTKGTQGSTSYVLPGAWFYLLARAHITAAFPFFHLPPPPKSYPGTFPSGYDSIEPTGGLLSNVPITALALVSWFVFRERADRVLRWLTTVFVFLGILLILSLGYALRGATMRYEVDFATLLLIPAVLTWFALARATSRLTRRTVKVVGSAALLWGAVFGLAIGMTGYENTLLTEQPGTYEFFERATTPIASAIVRLQGNEAQVVRVAPPGRITAAPDPPGLKGLSVALTSRPTVLYLIAPSSGRYHLAAQPSGGVWQMGANRCTNSSFESSTIGWSGLEGNVEAKGDETLSLVTTDHVFGSRALKVSLPNTDLQGTIYNSATGQAIPEATSVTASVWMKGTRGAALEMQIRIVNTDGTSSGKITSFTATGAWQRKTATAAITLGKTGDVVQILALRRTAAGIGSFLIDGAEVAPSSSSTPLRMTMPGADRERVVRLGELGAGIDLHLNRGLNRIILSTAGHDVVLAGMTLTRGIG